MGRETGMRRVTMGLAVMVLSMATVLAQETRPIAPAHDRAVRELIRQHIGPEYLEDVYAEAAGAAALHFQAQIQPALKRALSDDEKKRLWQFWHRKVKELMPPTSLEETLVPVVAKNLTLPEVEEINRFYQTPAGKKLASLTALLGREARSAGEEMVRKLADDKWVKSATEQLKAEFPSWFPAIAPAR